MLASLLYCTSALISVMVWEPKKAPTRDKAFPGLFADDAPQEDSELTWKRQQAGMAAYADAFNAAFRKRQQRSEQRG